MDTNFYFLHLAILTDSLKNEGKKIIFKLKKEKIFLPKMVVVVLLQYDDGDSPLPRLKFPLHCSSQDKLQLGGRKLSRSPRHLGSHMTGPGSTH